MLSDFILGVTAIGAIAWIALFSLNRVGYDFRVTDALAVSVGGMALFAFAYCVAYLVTLAIR